jgi:hypothetical protein
MTQYLLAAEADKIQDFIFRSSRLREVVGGSQLLSRFCNEVPGRLQPDNTKMEVIINAGGSFRICFNDKDKANRFGADLAEVYRRATGSSLTVAEPVEVIDDFGKASEMAEDNLRKAKLWHAGWQSQEQIPYTAFCASCGVGLATTYTTYHKSEDKQYLCASCLNKNAERKGREHPEELGPFLGAFFQEVIKEPERLAQASWPGKEERNGRSKKDPTEDIADYDPRRYVAYLLADGNAMGEVFGECKDPKKMHELSKGLTQAMHQALAVPTKEIMDNIMENTPSSDLFIPVLPLILGGDDLFALIPAPWALDFAQSFCQVYESEMDKLVKRLDLIVPRPTISAAVVICKSKHPYKLAHEAGGARLKDAKRTSKRINLEKKESYSAINFEVVLGGRLVSAPPIGDFRPTLRPYWVTNNEVDDCGLSIKRLIEQRWKLRDIPNKRLSELQSLYDTSLDNDEIEPWKSQLDRLLLRINQRNEDQGGKIETALKSLGDSNSPYWREVSRYPDPAWYGHGLPDLLEAWDFALKLDTDRNAYEVNR